MSTAVDTVVATARELLSQLSRVSWKEWAGIAAALAATSGTARVVYNLFFHPLRHIPGPLAWRATNLPWSWTLISGRLPFTVLSLHQQYGPVVRIRPDEVSFSDPRAWQDIYGHKVVGKMAGLASGLKELPKYDRFYKRFPKQPGSFLTADWHDHATQRRLIAPSFSDKSMREQEPILTEYIDLLMRRLYENADDGPVNLREWYNWATFDIMGDLAFGDSFGCLRSNTYHPFVSLIAGNPRINAVLISLRYMGLTKLTLLIFAVFVKTRKTVRSYGIQTMERRLAVGNPRPDLIEPFIEKKTKGELSYEQLVITAAVFIIAGSETTASLLTGVTFLLLTHPEALAKATAEVRAAFKSEKDITLNGVQNLKYMIACLTEALRYYPPAPAGFPREVPEGGAIIADTPLPPETAVSVYPWVSHHMDSNWVQPFEYRPERWLGDETFADDNKDAYRPFSFGPRDCVGKNLSYSEMRLILARMLWNFDMRLDDDSKGWLDTQKAFLLWQKPALNVHLTPAARADRS